MRKQSRYRPRPVHSNAVAIAINGARKLSAADVSMQIGIVGKAVREFSAGVQCPMHWRSLADTANMAETLSSIGICSGSQADEIINTAQLALAAVHGRHATRGTWTLYAAELDALGWLAALHGRQLAECSYREFEQAYHSTERRIAQARAGNAPVGAVVVQGDISARRAA